MKTKRNTIGNFITGVVGIAGPIMAIVFILLQSGAFGARGQTPPFTGIIPGPIGLDTSPGILLVIDSDGSLRAFTDPSQPPFDGIEDTLVGVVNNSSKTILAIPINSSQQIFGFDGDGFCAVDPISGPLYPNEPAGCPFGPTGYEGPGVSFAPNPDLSSGYHCCPK